jgi:hypothetical protein
MRSLACPATHDCAAAADFNMHIAIAHAIAPEAAIRATFPHITFYVNSSQLNSIDLLRNINEPYTSQLRQTIHV